jgi:Peptidase family M23
MTTHARGGALQLSVLVWSLTGVTGCGGSGGPSGPSLPADATAPVLSVTVMDLGLLTDFLPFGALLDSGQANPAYELYTSADTATVRAASAGIVVAVTPNAAPQTDAEVQLRPSTASTYLLIYDHIVAPQVAVGQTVAAGQTLGQIGPFNDRGRNRNGRVELQINRGAGADAVAVCPRDFGTADFNAAHAAALARFPARGSTVCTVATVRP